MGESFCGGNSRTCECAVVLPVDLEQQVRVVEWPGGDGLATLYREIGCETVDLRAVGDLGFWMDDEGAVGEEWAANDLPRVFRTA